MALHLILGNPGSGKSYRMYEELIRQSGKEPDRSFLCVVPEQFTLSTQSQLVKLHPDHILRNIEVLSFARLAYRIFSELGTKKPDTLEEVGKNLVLRRVAEKNADRLTVLKRQLKKPGYISELKSLISELQQYDIPVEMLDEIASLSGFPREFEKKIKDIRVIYQGFQDFLKDHYITREEIPDLLCDVIEESRVARNAVFSFDDFTGFTPVQKKLLYRIFSMAKDIYVTVTIDPEQDYLREAEDSELFAMSKRQIKELLKIAKETNTMLASPILCPDLPSHRFREDGEIFHLLKTMAEGERGLEGRSPYSGRKNHEIHLLSLLDRRRELEYTAAKIRELCRTRGYQYKDFGIVCPDLASYQNLVPRIFDRYQIPCFVDGKTSLDGHPLMEFVRGLFEIQIMDFSYRSVFHLLRSGIPILSREDTDLLDNYVLAMGIRGRSSYEKPFPYLPGNMTEDDLALINEIRENLMGNLTPFLDEIEAAEGNPRLMAMAICHLLDRLKVRKFLEGSALAFEKAGDDKREREDSEVFAMLLSLLHKMADILEDEKLTAEDFLEILNAGFETFRIGRIPPSKDRVLFGDITRTRLEEIKVLFLLGANEGQIPKSEERGGILSDLERNMLAEDGYRLSETTRERSFEQRFYLFRMLSKPSDLIYISTSVRNADGSEGKPSYLFRELKKIFPGLSVERPDAGDELSQAVSPETAESVLVDLLQDWKKRRKEDRYRETASVSEGSDAGSQADSDLSEADQALSGLMLWFQKTRPLDLARILSSFFYLHQPEQLSAAVGQLLSKKNLKGSVSKMEQYAACPYSYFLTYGLNLKERKEHELSDQDVGIIYHDVLKRYSDILKSDPIYKDYDFSTVTDDISDEILDRCIEDSYGEMARQEFLEDARSRFTLELMKHTLHHTVDLIRNQIRRGRFLPDDFEVNLTELASDQELSYPLSNGEVMHFTGRIDRIDIMQSDGKVYVKIIDYKSGSKEFSAPEVYGGLMIQLLIYMDAALAGEKRKFGQESVPAAAYLYHVQEPLLDETKGMEETDSGEDQDRVNDQIIEETLKNVGHDGLANADEKVLLALDQNPGGKTRKSSPVYPKASNLISEESFRKVLSDVRDLVVKEGEEIRAGRIEARPYRLKGSTGCDYCKLKSVCGFDSSLNGFRYREIDPNAGWKEN
ncbi:MAG: PD-(D/E)XK nuclease family protein [Lachnospiraceae bacterium]|nr:PD-(D/E)XK nuclease family protein [Lachnospiraceae bacterium]